ncbi:RNA binding motif protein 22 [Terramyces sp. JEL0728]|nr:RNA binding motif protein 22 [Terramyces sp. JEL0728]
MGSRQVWEQADFPILCESCLGPNPYVRMLKERYGLECKVCGRPYTVFKWCPGLGERFRKTEICQTCTKIKNCCQTCLKDLEYGVHTRDRDEVLDTHNAIPMTDMGGAEVVNHGKAESAAKEVLKKLAKATADPYTQRNRTTVCAFYQKGNCKRDKDCPFLHEMQEKKMSKKLKEQWKEKEKTVPLEKVLDLPVQAPPKEGDANKYPSQNPALLGTSTPELAEIIKQKDHQIKTQQHQIILLRHQISQLQRRSQKSVEIQTDERVECRAFEIIQKTIRQIKLLIEKEIIAEPSDTGLSFIIKSLLALHHKHNLLAEANEKLVLQNKELIKENLLLLKRKKYVQDDLDTVVLLLKQKMDEMKSEKTEIEILQKHKIEKYLNEYVENEKQTKSEEATVKDSLAGINKLKELPKFKFVSNDGLKMKGKYS